MLIKKIMSLTNDFVKIKIATGKDVANVDEPAHQRKKTNRCVNVPHW